LKINRREIFLAAIQNSIKILKIKIFYDLRVCGFKDHSTVNKIFLGKIGWEISRYFLCFIFFQAKPTSHYYIIFNILSRKENPKKNDS
jgi:hypothetical protein